MKKEKVLNIYLAEDEIMIRNWLKMELQNMGHNIVGEASSGRVAVAEILNVNPDLIIMDINMPDLDGLSAIEEINQHRMIPVVIITGYSNPELIDRANEAGVFGYLIKPVDTNELRSMIIVANRRFEEFQLLRMDLNHTKEALEDRKYIEKAKGILMNRFGLQEVQAMQALQKKSRNTNQKLVKVAKEIIASEKVLL